MKMTCEKLHVGRERWEDSFRSVKDKYIFIYLFSRNAGTISPAIVLWYFFNHLPWPIFYDF